MFCILSRNVRCDLKNAIQICFLQKLFEWFIFVIMLDHLIVNFSDHLVLFLANNACSFLIIKWRMSDETSSLMKHLIKVRRLIKLDESDSLNLTSKNVISSKLTKASSHQTWNRHLIKLLKRKTIFLFFDERFHAATHNVKKFNLAENHFRFVRK